MTEHNCESNPPKIECGRFRASLSVARETANVVSRGWCISLRWHSYRYGHGVGVQAGVVRKPAKGFS